MTSVELAVIVSTFERPLHLQRCLRSVAGQQGLSCELELIVTDDGSADDTEQVVQEFADSVRFPVRFVTHPHRGFRLARCRNQGVLASQAPYLVFTDGDCVLPPRHLAEHLRLRKPGFAVVGGCYRLDRQASQQITPDVIAAAMHPRCVPAGERLRMIPKSLRAWTYALFRHPMLPRLTGCDFAVWRSDYFAVNGHDENFIGWGLEDRDLQRRLSRLGVRFRSLLHRSVVSHLWHPPHPSFSRNNLGTDNRAYFDRPHVPTRCLQGLINLEQRDLRLFEDDGRAEPDFLPRSELLPARKGAAA